MLAGIARIHEGIGDLNAAVEQYKLLLGFDRFACCPFISASINLIVAVQSTSVEAIASLAAHNFYSDQPECALQYYRFETWNCILFVSSLSL